MINQTSAITTASSGVEDRNLFAATCASKVLFFRVLTLILFFAGFPRIVSLGVEKVFIWISSIGNDNIMGTIIFFRLCWRKTLNSVGRMKYRIDRSYCHIVRDYDYKNLNYKK